MSNTIKFDVNHWFTQAAATFAEAVHTKSVPTSGTSNVFGRPVVVSATVNLARLQGLASTGVRCAALITADELEKNLASISSLKRMHVPFTLQVEGNALGYLPKIAQTGSIVLQAVTPQQVLDFVLIGQVISEKTLVPVVVLADVGPSEAEVKLPTKKELAVWFGDPDGRVPDPTPAETMVLGKMRSRMPAWVQTDIPVLLGAQKNHADRVLEVAAQSAYEHSHINAMISGTLADFNRLTGRLYEAVQHHGPAKSKNVVITTSAHIPAGLLAEKEMQKNHVAVLSLFQLNPLPNLELREQESMLVLEAANYTPDQGFLFKQIALQPIFAHTRKQSGWYAQQPTETGLRSAISNLLNAKSGLKNYWLDVALTHKNSAYPKYQVLLQQVARDYPEANEMSLSIPQNTSSIHAKPVPTAVKQIGSQGPPYARLNRFFDDTACLYDQPEEITAHPFQAVPVLPVQSAVYHYPNFRKQVPEFHPEKVVDVERYPAVCPHGALLTALFTLGDIIKSGIAQARSRGENMSQIVPLSKVWAKNAAVLAIAGAGKVRLAEEILAPAFEQTLPAAKDQAAAKVEYEQIMLGIGKLPISITQNFFVAPEMAKPESGELFSLAIDPTACTGCGMCAEATAEKALVMKDYVPTDLGHLVTDFNRFDAGPETPAATVKRLIESNDFDPFAALLLNKALYRAFVRGGIYWQKASEGISLGMLIAAAEYVLQNNYEEVSKKISVQTAGINAVIKKVLSDALPVTNLDALMDVVTSHSEEKLSMERIFSEWGQEQQFKAVNKEELQRKLELIEGLKQLKWALKEGPNGSGRAKYSVVVADDVAYAAQHPWNVFNVPVLFAEAGSAADMALGMMEGNLRAALDNIKLLRRAELEANGKYLAAQHDAEIATLSFADVTEEERLLISPVLLIAGTIGETMALQTAIERGYPIKVLVLETGAVNPESASAQLAERANALWPLLAQGKAFVGRGSLANRKNLFALAEKAFTQPGAAVLGVFTPNAFAFDARPAHWLHMAALAESSRAFLPFTFAPAADATVAAQVALTLQNMNSDWNKTTLSYSENGEEKQLDYTLTFADYAYLLNDWKGEFSPLENAATAVSVADYLNVDEAAAKAKQPAITRVDAEGKLVRYTVSKRVVEACKTVRKNFRLLRELAGLHTEFPEKLREAVDAELRVAYEAEKKKLVAELAAEKKTWEAANLETIKSQMKERLLQMAGQL